jgi:hypothetical protein
MAALAACLFVVPGLSYADAGHALFAIGDAKIAREGARITLMKDSVVQSGDEIRTGYPAQVMLDMEDGSKLAIPHDTTFSIDKFSQSSTGGSAIFSLIKGAFRTVSGLIGKGEGDQYQMNTPVATMGIRGTDYAAVFKANHGKRHPDGLYFTVNKGRIFVKNAGGIVEFAAGQSGYVRDINTLAIVVTGIADVFKQAGLDPNGQFSATFAAFGMDGRLDINSHGSNLEFNTHISEPEIPASPS